MYMYACIYTFLSLYVNISTSIYICIFVYVYLYFYMYIHIHINKHVRTQTHALSLFLSLGCSNTHVVCMRAHVHTSAHIDHVPPVNIPYIQTRAQMRTCAHMHTRIRKATRIYRLATLAISHTHASHTHERTHTSFHTHAHTHRKHTHAHDTHAQPRSCIHTHIHTHTHTLTRTHIAKIHTHACWRRRSVKTGRHADRLAY